MIRSRKKHVKIRTDFVIQVIDKMSVIRICKEFLLKKDKPRDFPGGAVVKNPPANAGDLGSIPGPGRSHMPRSN